MLDVTHIIYPSDCIFLQGKLLDLGWYMDIPTIQHFWEWRSNEWDAQWLVLTSTNDIELVEFIHRYTTYLDENND